MRQFKTLDDFYRTDVWEKIKEKLKTQCGGICQRCGRVMSDWSKLIVHHIIPLTMQNVYDPNISLNENNLEVVCIDCHNAEHNRFGHHEQKVFIVYGSPCSGKSSYVNSVKKRGDLIFDIDQIWKTISGCELFEKPDCLTNIVLDIRRYIINAVKMRQGKWNNAYIIGGYANKIKREQLAKQLGAEMVFINKTKEECIRNLQADKTREAVKLKWLGYIDDWFNEYVE